MKPIKLYRYAREGGGVTISPVNPDVDYQELLRLIADKGKLLTDGNIQVSCIDVSTSDGWTEIDIPEEVSTALSLRRRATKINSKPQ